jgi:hypothetical protein
MTTVLLIGFEYSIGKLVGTLVDLYRAYEWSRSFSSSIYLLTDIAYYQSGKIAPQEIRKDPSLQGFPAFGASFSQLEPKFLIHNQEDLLQSLHSVLSKLKDTQLIIYYSGHGQTEGLVLPDGRLWSFLDFRDSISDLLSEKIAVFWILDCCNPNGLGLPFKLSQNTFRISSTNISCVRPKILLLTSAEPNEKSISTATGSLFSTVLFQNLQTLTIEYDQPPFRHLGRRGSAIPNNKNRNLQRLIGNLGSSIRKVHSGYLQTISVYSSHLFDPVLWLWIGSKNQYRLSADSSLSFLVFEKRSERPDDPPDNPEIIEPPTIDNFELVYQSLGQRYWSRGI